MNPKSINFFVASTAISLFLRGRDKEIVMATKKINGVPIYPLSIYLSTLLSIYLSIYLSFLLYISRVGTVKISMHNFYQETTRTHLSVYLSI